MLNKLDLIDKRILKALQHNGRLQNIELAEQVGLSPSPCLRRVKLLEERGVIQRYVALIDPEKVGKSLSVYVRIWLNGQGQALVDLVGHNSNHPNFNFDKVFDTLTLWRKVLEP